LHEVRETFRLSAATNLEPMVETDASDVAAVLAGDSEHFEAIVLRYQRPLIRYAMRFTDDRSTAEDMAQDALVACYRSLNSWRAESQFSTWLFAVALNVYRSRMRRMQPLLMPLDEAMLVENGTEQRSSNEQQASLVRRAVGWLPPKYRDALVTFYFRDANLAESAQLLGIPQGTMKARLHRARRMLAERLAPLLGRKEP
jgi:RNA polymerase sigma-70 factor (ECF subfamily)